MAVDRFVPESTITTFECIPDFLHRVTRFFDDGDFDRWLDCYHPEAEFWVPAWNEEDEITMGVQSEPSLIHYTNRNGIEDHVSRIYATCSAVPNSKSRICHNITNVEIVDERGEIAVVRFDWRASWLRCGKLYSRSGSACCVIDCTGTQPVIMKKKVVGKHQSL